MGRTNRIVGAIFIVIGELTAQALTFDTGFMLGRTGNGEGETSISDTRVGANLNLDIELGPMFFFGAKVLAAYRANSAGSSETLSATYFAPGVNFGYGSDAAGWRVAGFAMLSPTEWLSGKFTYARYGGFGYGVEASYLYKFANSAVGPKLSYQLDSSTHEFSGGKHTKLKTPAVNSRLEPYITWSGRW